MGDFYKKKEMFIYVFIYSAIHIDHITGNENEEKTKCHKVHQLSTTDALCSSR